MNAKRLTTAFLIALFVSAVCTWLLSRKMGTHAAEHVPVARYVAPAKPLQAGEVLKAEDLELVSWPAANPIAGTFTKVDDLVGRAALYPLDKDQPITEKLLSASGAGAGLAGKIPDGMRAIALRSDEVMGVAGFLFPGSHVDVLVTYRSGSSPEPMTLTVLQDAEVLAAGQKVQPDPDGKPVTATVVTLLLTPADAQRAVLASTQGAIHFVLRGGADKARVKDAPLALSQLSAESIPPPSPVSQRRAAIRRVAVPRQIVVETIAGDKLSSETFNEVR
ncbi:MAG: Flp pilus assembly protein CpaB [Acidobacteriaceae bacterium]